jgi:hypothetical protein
MTKSRAPYGFENDASKNESLDQLLLTALESQHEVEIPEAEKALIIAYAKDILFEIQNPPLKLKDPDTQKRFANEVVLAATAAALEFEMQLLQKDCKAVIKKLTDPDLKLSPDEKKQLTDTLKNTFKALNKLDPKMTPEKRKAFDELLTDDRFLEKLVNLKKDAQLIKDAPKGAEPTSPTMGESKELKATLENLLGFDPQNPGLRIPVLAVVGNFMGIPDASAALNAESPQHALSGDFEIDGRDLHMQHLEGVSKLADFCNMPDRENVIAEAAFSASHSAPRLTQ